MPRAAPAYAFGDFVLDTTRRTLTRRGEAPSLLPSHAIEVLFALVRRPGQVVRRADLLNEVWPDVLVVDNSLSQAVAALRRALRDDPLEPRYIATIPRRGYRFVADVSVKDADRRAPEAHQLYALGWSALTRPDGARLMEARRHLESAVGLDPAFAMAWVRLAEVYFMSMNHGLAAADEALPKMREAVERATRLAPERSEVHAMKGRLVEKADLDWSGAARHFRRGLELNPNCYASLRALGFYMTHCGRFDEAIEIFRRCQAIEPLAVNIHGNIGMALYFARRYETAIAQLTLTLQMDPAFAVSRRFLGRALMRSGRIDEAIREFEASSSTVHGGPADLPVAWAMTGRASEARAALRELIANDRTFDVAAVHAALGHDGQAMTWLERAADTRTLATFAVDPLFDRLRPTSRFQRLMRRVGLAPPDLVDVDGSLLGA